MKVLNTLCHDVLSVVVVVVLSRDGQEWSMTLRYYHDPECSRPSFTLQTVGTYTHAKPAPYAHDFTVNRLVLTPEDPDLADALNSNKGKDCGQPGTWAARRSQDVTSTGGCQAVGVRVPSLEKEILRTGLDEEGGMWLTLGQPATTSRQLVGSSRPTSWGPPLVSCRQYDSYEHDNSLRPMMGARTASNAPPVYTSLKTALVFLILLHAWLP